MFILADRFLLFALRQFVVRMVTRTMTSFIVRQYVVLGLSGLFLLFTVFEPVDVLAFRATRAVSICYIETSTWQYVLIIPWSSRCALLNVVPTTATSTEIAVQCILSNSLIPFGRGEVRLLDELGVGVESFFTDL